MADIHIAIRNQTGAAMSSVDGELVVVLLARNGRFHAQQPATLQGAMVLFFDLPASAYTIVVRHPALNPTEVRQDVDLPENTTYGVRFVYNEPHRQLMRIETELRFF